MDKAQSGDRKALEALLTGQQERVYRFGLRMCGDEDDARDVLQDTLFAMARTVKDFRGASSVSTWLFTIARSFCIKKRRRRRHEPGRLESLDDGTQQELERLPDDAPLLDEQMAARQLERAIEEAIRSLEPKYREVLVLRDVEGLTATEVSEVLGLSTAAVKSRLHRARVAMRDALAPLIGRQREDEPSGGRQAEDRRVDDCPDVLQVFSRYLEGEIGPDECAKMEHHVNSCRACEDACESLRGALNLCRSVARGPLPPQVRDLVQSSLRRALAAK